MRMLMLHIDLFRSVTTERSRSRLFEDLTPDLKATEVGESLLVLASVEKADEPNPENVSKEAVMEISRLARQLHVDIVVLHPFAHLFADLSKPEIAIRVLKLIQEGLIQKGFKALRTPFGWFNTLELRAKGHPLSRVARIVGGVS